MTKERYSVHEAQPGTWQVIDDHAGKVIFSLSVSGDSERIIRAAAAKLNSPEGGIGRVFIQWKGTNVCMDFNCDCGTHNHYDTDFAYFVQCAGCQRIFEVGTEVTMTETTDTRGHEPKWPIR